MTGLAHAVQFFAEAEQQEERLLAEVGSRVTVKNALTFDVEEYFHAEAFAGVLRPEEWPTLESRVVAATERLLDILDREPRPRHVLRPGLGRGAASRLVREIASLGHEIACHGYGASDDPAPHRARSSSATSARAKSTPRGRHRTAAVIGYRAPTFSIMRETLWSLDVLAEAGFRYDSSIFPIVHDRYGIPDAPRFPHRLKAPSGGEIAEFPMSTVRCSGGACPWRAAATSASSPMRSPGARSCASTAARGSPPWSISIRGSSIPTSPACRWAP